MFRKLKITLKNFSKIRITSFKKSLLLNSAFLFQLIVVLPPQTGLHYLGLPNGSIPAENSCSSIDENLERIEQ
jgi:hypothetical protein